MKRKTMVWATLLLLSACFHPTNDKKDGGSGGGTAAGGGAGGGTGGGTMAPDFVLALSPATATLPRGGTLQLSVQRLASDGSATDVTQASTWSSDALGVASVDGGRVTAVGGGAAKVTATFQGQSAVAVITVPQAALGSLALWPDAPRLPVGGTVQLAVVGTFSDGTQADLTGLASFSSSAPQVASVDSGGQVRAIGAGQASVSATVAGVAGSTEVTVSAAHPTAITVSPMSATLPQGAQLKLSAQAQFDDGTQADVTAASAWSTSTPAVAVLPDGTATGVSPGAATVTAAFGGLQASANLTVTSAALTGLAIAPATLTLPKGSDKQVSAVATYADGSTLDVTQQAIWSSSAPQVVAVSTAGLARGKVSGLSAGSASVTARFGALSAQLSVTVSPAALSALALSPASASIASGGTQAFTVSASFADGSALDVTASAIFSSTDPSLVTVSNGANKGLATAVGAAGGSAQVKASYQGLSASATVTVTPAPQVDAVQVQPDPLTVEAGKTAPLKAMAHYTDGNLKDVSAQASWASAAPLTASVSNAAGSQGQVKGIADGTTTISATLGSFTGSATVHVSPPTLVAITIDPVSQRLAPGMYNYVVATAVMSDGSTQDVSATGTWSSTDANVADVQLYQGYAYVMAGNLPGTATIKVQIPSGESASATVEVISAQLNQILIDPAQPQLAVGGSVDLAATGLFSDLSTMTLKYVASWTSSDPTVATVSNDPYSYSRGFVQALKPGTATITANYNGVIGTTVVTVSSATLQTIQITPFSPHLPVGFTTYLQATGIFSDNTTQDLSYLVSWSSSDPSVASIGAYGSLQPNAAGNATVTAFYQGVTGTNAVTVTAATLSSISLTPANANVAVQATKQLSALGTFSDGSSMDVTWYVTWLSDNTQVANVSNAWPYQGQAKGLSAGGCHLSAVRGSVSAITGLTVQ